MPAKISKQLGVTLIELLVTLTIAGILAGIAIPSFVETIRANRMATYANEFITALNLARIEAIKRGFQVTVKRKSGTARVWEGGWDVFVDLNRNGAFNDNGNATPCETNSDGILVEDCVLKTHEAFSSKYYLRTSNSTTYKDYASYLPNGMKGNSGLGDTFTLCYDSTGQTESRNIVLNYVGRARVEKRTASQCPIP